MNVTMEELSMQLKNKNINISHQRLKVLKYLNDHKTHPTAYDIYMDLHQEIPTLSKTTIYNTLNALVDAGLVNIITIDDNNTRYDIMTNNHGHFKCESCGEVYDFKVNIDSINTQDLKNFKINNKNVYFKGICPSCIS